MRTALGLAIAFATVVLQSPRGRAEWTYGDATVAVDYGRPELSGRDMVSLLPVGHTWRLGADEATRMESSRILRFGTTSVAAGAYSLFVKRLEENAWALVLNSETGQWGTQHDVTMDVATVPLEWERVDETVDRLTIELSGAGDRGELRILWGRDRLAVVFELD